MDAGITIRKTGGWLACGLLLGAAGPLHEAASGSIATIDAPGAGTGYGQGTIPLAINEAGTIAGSFLDSTQHGFLLSSQGSYTTFDAPGAAAGTYPAGLDEAGTVVGTYEDAAHAVHGFARAADGTFTDLSGPGGLDLLPSGISASGFITGTYADEAGLAHGFRLSPTGQFQSFEAAGAGLLRGQGTQAMGAGGHGQIAGIYTDLNNQPHPYTRTKGGGFATISPPGNFVSGFSYVYLFRFVPPVSLNAHGAAAGNYFQPLMNLFGGDVNGFIQSPGGALTVFGIGDTGPCCIFTYVTGLNDGGTAIGYDDDYYDINHGWLRTPDGTITVFDAPGAGTSFFEGTFPMAINARGFITGAYQDENHVVHGFVRHP